MNTAIVYGGRFQPFHPGHYAVYTWLVGNFGKSNVWIATSNKVDGSHSPLTFEDKKLIATRMFDIESDRFIQSKNPAFQPSELLDKLGPETIYVAVDGEKDVGRHSGKYFSQYEPKNDMLGYKDKGYYVAVPMQENGLSATQIRDSWRNNAIEQKKQFFEKLYGFYDEMVFQMLMEKL